MDGSPPLSFKAPDALPGLKGNPGAAGQNVEKKMIPEPGTGLSIAQQQSMAVQLEDMARLIRIVVLDAMTAPPMQGEPRLQYSVAAHSPIRLVQ